jgi:hypothetical protein
MKISGRLYQRVAVALLPILLCLFTATAGAQTGDTAVERATPPPISGRNLAEPETILSSDVLARVELVRANVELIRKYMGLAVPPAPVMQVSAARSRECYSQALNLERRANRLAFEQVRMLLKTSPPLHRNVRTYDVFQLVDGVLAAVLAVKAEMDIQVAVAEKLQSPDTVPTDVFNATVRAGSEINNLLAQETGSSDVFQTVTSAVHIAASLHLKIPDGPSFPEEPPFEPNKSPYDVFMRMQGCFQLISELAMEQGIDPLEFDIPAERALLVQQNDISDIAFLLVEELNGIHRRILDAPEPARAYYPGRKFAAHVYQRVGLLERVLQDLVDAKMLTPAASE